jgi:hypothetical protein
VLQHDGQENSEMTAKCVALRVAKLHLTANNGHRTLDEKECTDWLHTQQIIDQFGPIYKEKHLYFYVQ